jgi:hypothetical protein
MRSILRAARAFFGDSANGGPSFFLGSFSLSLAVPPAGSPLLGQETVGSSLKGIPPTVPSSRPAPPPLGERAIPLLTKQKRNYMPTKNAQPASQNKNAGTGSKLPVKTFRLGRIQAAVWENEADEKKFYNVTFVRTYLDEARNYHDTDSFGRDDLPLVAKLADQTHTFIFERLAELKTEHSE